METTGLTKEWSERGKPVAAHPKRLGLHESRMPSSRQDETKVERFLASRHLVAERLPRSIGPEEPEKPDFQVLGRNGELLFCEVKSIFAQTPLEGILHRTICNGLTVKFHKAAAQCRTVNSHHFVPNVLAWVSHNVQINVHTFRDLLRGHIRIDTQIIADLTPYRFGRLRADLPEIDLHVWLEEDDTPHWIIVNSSRPEFVTLLTRLFGIDRQNVEPV